MIAAAVIVGVLSLLLLVRGMQLADNGRPGLGLSGIALALLGCYAALALAAA